MVVKVINDLNNSVASLIRRGAVGVIPSDTIYGVVASAGNQQAVERLYTLKDRHHKPGTIVAASIDQLVELGIKRRYLKAVEHLWPNPLSVVIPVGQELDYLSQEVRSLAVRIPADPSFRSFLEKSGPLVTSSANHPNEQPAVVVAQAQAYFGEEVDFYVDGGDLSDAAPSTVIRVVDDAIEVLREGAVTIDEETGRVVSS